MLETGQTSLWPNFANLTSLWVRAFTLHKIRYASQPRAGREFSMVYRK